MNIILHRNYFIEDQFEETFLNSDLHSLASELYNYAFDYPGELEMAVQRAMQACRSLNIPVRKNFKPVYSFKDGEVFSDWQLSDLGRKLILLNADPSNPYIARLQFELIVNSHKPD